MNKKNIIILAIIILFLLLIALIVAIVLVNAKKESQIFFGETLNEPVNSEDLLENAYTPLQNYASTESDGIELEAYFNIKRCINNYLTMVNTNNDGYFSIDNAGNKVKNISDSEIASRIYNVLSKRYINNNNITVNNLFNKLECYNKDTKFILLDAKTVQNNEIVSFVVSGILVDGIDYSFIDRVYYIINIDIINYRYSIEPLGKKYNTINEISVTNLDESIEDNINNGYVDDNIDYILEARDCIERYKMLSISSPEIQYNLFPEEYRQKRFGSLENFKEYVKNNKQDIMQIKAAGYLSNNYLDTTGFYEHVIKDQYDNLYIISEKTKLNYTMKLDTYTIPTEKFNTTYASAKNSEKVRMNIDKFFDMLNANDYRTAYGVLNETFKNTYFPTEESFEQFMKQYTYTHANVKYANFSDKVSGVYTYYVELSDKLNANSKEIGMNIVMQLQEGTKFTLSFEVQP